MFSRNQVDRAGDMLRNDPTDAEALDVLEWWRRQHSAPLEQAEWLLRTAATESSWSGWQVSARLKKTPQVVRKLRASSTRLSTMDDIAGCRLLLDCLADVEAAVPLVGARLEVRTVKDMITIPSPVGYRAIHLLCRVDSRRVEVQLRTRRQHTWADMVEAHDRQSGEDAKHGNAPPIVIEGLIALSDILSTLDHQGH